MRYVEKGFPIFFQLYPQAFYKRETAYAIVKKVISRLKNSQKFHGKTPTWNRTIYIKYNYTNYIFDIINETR